MIDKDNFLGKNWLLDTSESIKLYHDVAIPFRQEVGIIDTHTHHNLRQIVENKPFPNIWRTEVLETRPVCDGRKILSEGSRFEVFDRIICKVVGNLVSSGQMSYNGGVRKIKALMYENQMRLFNLKGEINEQAGNFKVF